VANSTDDDDFFAQEMKGVKPLKVKAKAPINKASGPSPGQQQRHQDAQAKAKVDGNFLGVDHLEMVHPLDILTFRRDGLAHGVFRRFKQGKYQIDAKLDLHRKTVEQARREVFNFIKDCMKYDIRMAIILHGKGEKSDPPALLKSYANRWLREIPEVMAFHSAQRQHGGVGAVYVLMKKSEAKKLENREKYTR